METRGAKDREHCMRRMCSEEGVVGTRGGPKEHMGWQGWPSKGVRGVSAEHWEQSSSTVFPTHQPLSPMPCPQPSAPIPEASTPTQPKGGQLGHSYTAPVGWRQQQEGVTHLAQGGLVPFPGKDSNYS